MGTLREAELLCLPKKMSLFLEEVDFLGHQISICGIKVDPGKIEKILNWRSPWSGKEVHTFLGLVQYISAFLPKLAEYTSVLTPLTLKSCDVLFPPWTLQHEATFLVIRDLILGADCLTMIDHDNPGTKKNWVTCDVSQWRMGACLSFGETWESMWPVTFESQQMDAQQWKYPTHEQELLSISHALKKWHVDLLGTHINIYTNHCTLEIFSTQWDLSRHQCRWQEFLAQYDYTISYIKGEDNMIADTLLRLPDSDTIDNTLPTDPNNIILATVLSISYDNTILRTIWEGYDLDLFCIKLKKFPTSCPGLTIVDNLLYINRHLVIPWHGDIWQGLFILAHNSLGHFGFEKLYRSLKDSYYWPNMCKDLEKVYIPSCVACQRSKGTTQKPVGPLHLTPVPDNWFKSITINFIRPLPKDEGFDGIIMIMDMLGVDYQIIPCKSTDTASAFALRVFNRWYCEHGLPDKIYSDWDKLFVFQFWKALTCITSVKLKMSTAYYPETDGSSEWSNKTINQSIRYHVSCNQLGWVWALPQICFNMMNTVNTSMGFSGFQLMMGQSPRVIPLLLTIPSLPDHNSEVNNSVTDACIVLQRLEDNIQAAKDNLLLAKVSQAAQKNKGHSAEKPYAIGDRVMLSIFHQWRDYVQKGQNHVAKFMPRFNGPYMIWAPFHCVLSTQ